jgi:hypothetical protein
MQSELLRVFEINRTLNENLSQQTKTDHECETIFMLHTF